MIVISDQRFSPLLVRPDISSGWLKIIEENGFYLVYHSIDQKEWLEILKHPVIDSKGKVVLGIWPQASSSSDKVLLINVG